MDDLSEEARRLIDTAMGEDEEPPPDASWGAFVVHMTGMQPRSEEVIVTAPPKAPTRRWPALVIVVAIAAAVGVWLVRRTPDDDAQGKARAPTPTKTSPPPRTRESTAVPPPRKDAVEAPDERPPIESLIGDAQAALAANDPARALALLEEHAERAPLADDAEHRMALRVLTLCALDRRDDASAEGRAFLESHPSSRWAPDVSHSCAAK